MRSLLLLSILLGAATACKQSLTPDMTGTGGSRTGSGGEGGTISGAGGSGGSVSAVCDALVGQYRSAVSAAEACQVGASGQCQQLVTGSLNGCSCATYVTDSAMLSAIEDAWQAAGCVVSEPPCKLFCPAALNTTCVSTDGGSAGFCSYAPGTGGISGAGGTTGAGGSTVDGGLSNCGTLASEYAAALIVASSCSAGAGGQCAQQVNASLSLCNSGCTRFVNDRSVLDTLRTKWDAVGCGNVPVACPAIACAPAVGASCVPGDGGGSVCSTSYGTFGAD